MSWRIIGTIAFLTIAFFVVVVLASFFKEEWTETPGHTIATIAPADVRKWQSVERAMKCFLN